jgi:hypothetical protein
MSRRDEMTITIREYNEDLETEVQDAVADEWPVDYTDWLFNKEKDRVEMEVTAEGYLCGGLSEEEFTKRISYAIWKANKAYCVVVVGCTYLEDLPYEEHSLTKDAYEKMLKEEANASDVG